MTQSNMKHEHQSRPITSCAAVCVIFALAFAVGCGKESEPKIAGAHDEHAEHKEGEHRDEVTLAAEAIQKYGIVTTPVKKHVLVPTFMAPSRVSFNTDAMAHVGAVLRGRAVDLKVRKGDHVNKGDELLIIESPELGEAQSDFIQKRTAVETARPGVEIARSSYERAKSLFDESRGIALSEVQKREADYKMAQGALVSAEAARTAAENTLRLLGMDQSGIDLLIKTGEILPRYTIRAPISGQVISREVTLGELVNPDKEALLVIADMSTIWVIADVPESRLKDVAIGANAKVYVSSASVDASEGTVSFIDSSLDPSTRSAQVRVVIKDGHNKIRPGMFAQVEIAAPAIEVSEAVLAIPDEAVQTVEGGPAVFVPVTGEENTFAKRPVVVGKAIGGWSPVTSGLTEGESVVSKGSFILKAELGKGEAAHEH